MNMRSGTRRERETLAVSPQAFAWGRAWTATLRHISMPWNETVSAKPLTQARELGTRDRLSLLAQFAAHQAFLRFAGLADGELDLSEWVMVPKRGSDVRLIRIAARESDASTAPPVLTLAQQFAELVNAEAEVLSHSWARADAVYEEVHARLRADAAADLRWLLRSACGSVDAPGPDGLRTLAMAHGQFGYRDAKCLQSLERWSDPSLRMIVLRGASPLSRYSALGALVSDPTQEESVLAERILAATSSTRHLFVIANPESFDGSSRRVVELLRNARHADWLLPGGENPLPETRLFIVAPRLTARAALEARIVDRPQLECFVESPLFGAWLAHGHVPPAPAALPMLAEPARSYIGALALLGREVPRATAVEFLGEFLFHGALEELVIEGLTQLIDDIYSFVSDAVRAEAMKLIPPASRSNISRVAAPHASGVDGALLWLDGGEAERASAVLAATRWRTSEELVEALQCVPRSLLNRELATRYAHALIDCGRYRDARDVGAGDELVLARAERRMGDYAAALARLDRIEARSFDAELLRGELLRLLGREELAARALDACRPSSDEERIRLAYERAILMSRGTDELPPHYLTARLATYRAIDAGDYDAAPALALASLDLARCVTERIDAWLDRLYAVFCAGQWDRARAIAVEALEVIEETQGDRAAAGILFTLAYLAADDAQWTHAQQRIARLRHYYAATHDDARIGELLLLTAHLDFSRGDFADAQRDAAAVYGSRGHDPIREAAALILDEIAWMEGNNGPLLSTGKSPNVELARRHARLLGLREGTFTSTEDSAQGKLRVFRESLQRGDRATAQRIARELDLLLDPPAGDELRILRLAATCEFPYAPHDFDLAWCFATRNRLGNWSVIGSHPPDASLLDEMMASPGDDWIACSERELLHIAGSKRWPAATREALAAVVRSRAENHRLRRIVEQEASSVAAPPVHAIDGLIGESAAMREVHSLIARVARRDVAVCILGESGTGKELVARAIHRHSPRRQKTFTAVNCAALPENLIESELFGHVRGAFTGADRDRAGLIETTDGGTLFLDEIGEMPLTAQAKLLRFLQEGEFRRVGDTVNRTADVRIVSATNRKLEASVEEGSFRDDLYYRIRGVEIPLPPLRERGADILLLTDFFLAHEGERHHGGPSKLSADAEAIFTAYGWPGNVRELQNTIRAAHAMAGEAKEINVEHLPDRLRGVAPSRTAAGSYQEAVTRFKRELIERSLVQANGNQNRAAAALKISRQALAYQIRELGVLIRR
ncbi:MAG TPA: sigma 54-interacting transcriptional regulator [Thermoanaerobaculia bacterium]|jgi:DNA-binding NtrC family response regulator/tetratricopeptide (TPR) repeat protein